MSRMDRVTEEELRRIRDQIKHECNLHIPTDGHGNAKLTAHPVRTKEDLKNNYQRAIDDITPW